MTFERGVELIEPNRFGEKVVHARGETFLPILLGRVCGDGDDVGPRGGLCNSARSCSSGNSGESAIHSFTTSAVVAAERSTWGRVKTLYRPPPEPAYYLSASVDTMLWDQGATPGTAWYYVVTAIDVHQNQSVPSNEAMVDGTATGIDDTPVPTALMLWPNAPNPFNGSTDIHIGLPRATVVSFDIFDVAGRRVASRRYGTMSPGWQRIPFDGLSDKGARLPSGVYFYRITAAGETVTRKLVIER